MSADIGIDMGTDSVLVYIRGKGLVLKEPSLMAVDLCTKTVKAVGEEARLIPGRKTGLIKEIHPIRNGSIPDYDAAKKMIKYLLCKSLGKKFFIRPSVGICVPFGAANDEKKTLKEAAFAAGAGDVRLTETPVAAAVGAGIDIFRACGNMVADIGAGSTDIAVIFSGKAVAGASLKMGGGDFDKAILRHMRKRHGLIIGRSEAEDIKIKIGAAFLPTADKTMEVRGRDLVTGLPRAEAVTSSETGEVFRNLCVSIAEALLSVLQKAPPHLSADIKERGIVLTGGTSLLHGLERFIEEKIGVHTVTADEPASAAAAGAGMYQGFMD